MLKQLAGIWALDTWVKPFFSRYKKTLVASLGLGVLTLLFAVMLMFVSGFLISYASLPPELGLFSLYIPIGFVQVFGLGKPFFGYFERLASHDWVLRMTSTLREQLYRVLEADGIAGSKIMESGEALGLLSEDIAHVQNLYLRTVFPLVIAWLTGGIVVLAIGAMSAPCAVMLFIGLIVITVLLPLEALLVNGARTAKAKTLKAKLYASAYDNVMGIADWVCAQRRADYQDSVSYAAAQIDAVERKLAASSRHRALLLNALFALLVVTILLWAGGCFGDPSTAAAEALGSLSDNQAGTWIAAIVLGFFPLLEAFQPLPDAASGAAAHLGSIEHLNKFEQPCDDADATGCDKPSGMDIRLDKVGFAYAEGDAALLKEVSLEIKHGEKLAILGASGSGKSTLLHLLRGDLEPSSGTVTLGGVSATTLNEAGKIHQHVGYMQQDSYLFAQTLMGNLKVGNPKVTQEEAVEALEAAGLGPLFERLPQGLATPVDEAGLRFSGGERQRIALARLLLAQTPVVLLDEPTVSLDPLTEAKLLDTVFDVLEDRTVIMVTHHLQGIEHMDRVLLIQDGKIALDGSPHELAATSTLFQQLLAFDRGLEL